MPVNYRCRSMSKVSIYATAYNNADRIAQSLDSIMGQFPDFDKNFEIVVVDNFSTDGTWEILMGYSLRHDNIKVFQLKCSKGMGRQKAFERSSGDYVFHVDLDSVYLKSLSAMVYNAIKRGSAWKDRNNTVCGHIFKRTTMERVGGWKDLNVFEDTELSARVISKNVRFLHIPVLLCENEMRPKVKFRDAKHTTGSIRRLMRLYNSAKDTIAGNGMAHFSDVRNVSIIAYLGLLFAFIMVRLEGRKIYRYSKDQTNDRYCQSGMSVLSPALFNIPRRYWLCAVYSGFSGVPGYEEQVKALRIAGFDRVRKARNFLIFSTEDTDKKLLLREAEQLGSIVV